MGFPFFRSIRPQVMALGAVPLGLLIGILIALGFVYVWASSAAEQSIRANRVLELTHRVSALVDVISTASAEQSAGVAQVSLEVSRMDRSTQENAALVEQGAAAAANLKAKAHELVASVAAFRL